jgi:uncharacterized glyoxalase superfamily protein PhnB
MGEKTSTPAIWPVLSYRDARAAIAFLTPAFGFEERAVYARDDDPTIVEHAELRWPLGGGIMFGSAGALYERATAAGAEVVRGLVDEDYGSRGFTVRDLEGNLWSFGTYTGH